MDMPAKFNDKRKRTMRPMKPLRLGHRELRVESLEERTLMAGDFSGGGALGQFPDINVPFEVVADNPTGAMILSNGLLTLYGTQQDDVISIVEYSPSLPGPAGESLVIASVKDINNQVVAQGTFLRSTVDEIVVYAWGGDDTVTNETSIASTQHGGQGNDTLYGGSTDDTLLGEAGLDGMFGGGGGNDRYFGGTGADRFLRIEHLDAPGSVNSYFIEYLGQEGDIIVNFDDGNIVVNKAFDGGTGTASFGSGEWSVADVRIVDRSLAALHHKTANTDLLRNANDTFGNLTLVRHGLRLWNPDGPSVTAWNSSGKLHFTQDLFDLGPERVMQTVFHEVGHNWDSAAENPAFWNDFKAISGWHQCFECVTPALNDSYLKGLSETEDWWYNVTATFASNYAKTNPREDFADSFAAYFMDDLGLTFSKAPGPGAIPFKLQLIEDFLHSKTTYVFVGAAEASAFEVVKSGWDFQSEMSMKSMQMKGMDAFFASTARNDRPGQGFARHWGRTATAMELNATPRRSSHRVNLPTTTAAAAQPQQTSSSLPRSRRVARDMSQEVHSDALLIVVDELDVAPFDLRHSRFAAV